MTDLPALLIWLRLQRVPDFLEQVGLRLEQHLKPGDPGGHCAVVPLHCGNAIGNDE